MDGTPNSFNRRDLVNTLDSLRTDQVYYMVYMRDKTPAETGTEQAVSLPFPLAVSD